MKVKQNPFDESVLKRMFIEYLNTNGPCCIEGMEFKPSEVYKECGGAQYYHDFNTFVERLKLEDYNRVIAVMVDISLKMRREEDDK